MGNNTVGVIAEDVSDVEVLRELIKKIVPGIKFSTKHFVGRGCGSIPAKCQQWADVLKLRGCTTLILIQDLDNEDLHLLYEKLRINLSTCSIHRNVIVIPIKEIEAWLLSDNNAIKRAMHIKKEVTRFSNPQGISDPKRTLGEVISKRSEKTKRYLNTVDNPKIAAELDLINVRRCSSFNPLESFVMVNIK